VGFAVVIFFVISAARPKQARLPKTVDLALPDVKRRAPPPVMESGSSRGPVSEEVRPPPRAVPPRRPPPDRPPAPRVREEHSSPAIRAQAPASAPAAAGQAQPRACVTSHTPPELRLSGRITKTPYSIGRAAGNDLVVQVDNRVGVSGKHASIIFDQGRYFVIDQKSTYGTTLNDQRLEPNAPTPLEEGAVIGLGPRIKIKFSLQDCA
jgi:pSer/pThr/pTyr-binding forkhead associated (FHA) protein